MSKPKGQQEETALAPIAAGETALTPVPQDLIDDAGVGTESIGADDVRPPRLRLAQSNTPQAKRGNPKQIADLREGDLFNDLTNEVYGPGPLAFVVVSRLGVRHVEFAPLDDGGGVLDFNVPAGDPRTEFHTDPETGKRVKPVATKFVDYLVWLPDRQELAALSLKGTQLKVAQTIDSLLRYPLKIGGTLVARPPAWARLFALETTSESGNGNSWAGLRVKQAGVADAETRAQCKMLHEFYASKNVVIEREDEREPDDDGGDARF